MKSFIKSSLPTKIINKFFMEPSRCLLHRLKMTKVFAVIFPHFFLNPLVLLLFLLSIIHHCHAQVHVIGGAKLSITELKVILFSQPVHTHSLELFCSLLVMVGLMGGYKLQKFPFVWKILLKKQWPPLVFNKTFTNKMK